MSDQSICRTCGRWRHATIGGAICTCDGVALLEDLNEMSDEIYKYKRRAKALIEAYEKLCAAYRLGRHPSEKTLSIINKGMGDDD